MREITEKQQVDLNQLKEEMFAELRRLNTLLRIQECHFDGIAYPVKDKRQIRNYSEIFNILDSLGQTFDKKRKIAVISKDIGDFILNIKTGAVYFTPIICIKCKDQNDCAFIQRKLCIIENSEGWTNYSLSPTDLLIISKIFAIVSDLLPNHVINQIKSLSDCFNKRTRIKTLEDNVIQQISDSENINQNLNLIRGEAPPMFGPIPPPQIQKSLLRFKPPPQEIKYNLDHPNMIKLRCSILKELKNLQKLMDISKSSKSTLSTH